MTHDINTKKRILKLFNKGFTKKQIYLKTGVTEKTIRKWVRNWKNRDAPRHEILKELWSKLEVQSKQEKLNAEEIKSITNDIFKLQRQIAVRNAKYNHFQ